MLAANRPLDSSIYYHCRVLLASVLLIFPAFQPLMAQDVLTYHNDNGRTGQNLNETKLTPANVNPNTFGRLFTISVDGKVDAQPLYKSALLILGKGIHNALFVVTENDSAYAFDADTGAPLWQVSMLGSGESPSDDRGCSQVTPTIGITASPVVDPAAGRHGTLYLVAMSKDGAGNYYQRLHALDITTGQEQSGSPVTIQATSAGSGDEGSNGTLVFDPKQHEDRAALLLLNGVIYTSWSSHCDFTPYTGWIIGYDETTLRQSSVLNLAPNGSEASIWMSGAGPAADAAGNIYALVANGTFDPALNPQGFPSQSDYGNAFLKVSTASNALSVADYFDMLNTVAESAADEDLGSGGVLVLPDLKDAQGKVRHLAIGAGKDQILYLVDRDNMGKFNAAGDQIYQELKSVLQGPVFGMPAWFSDTLYYGAVSAPIIALAISNAQFSSTPSSQTSIRFEYPGATPSISANGASSGILWAAENTAPAVLHAYDASNLGRELYNSNMAAHGRDQFGDGNKFITPTIANGKVYVGTTGGLGVFGLLIPQIQLSPASLSFGGELVGQTSGTQTVTLSNAGSVTLSVTSISATGDFSETNNCGASVKAGANCAVQLTFKPSAGGNRSGTLTVADSATGSPQVIVLSGTGQDFSMQAASGSSTAVSIAAGQTASYTINLSPLGGFSHQVALSCSGAPSESTCSISPSPATLNGTSATTVSVAVRTTAPSYLLPSPVEIFRRIPTAMPLAALAATFFALLLARGSRVSRLSFTRLGGLLILVSTATWILYCGGSSSSTSANAGTPHGNYSLTITAIYSSAGASLQQTLSLTLTVD